MESATTWWMSWREPDDKARTEADVRFLVQRAVEGDGGAGPELSGHAEVGRGRGVPHAAPVDATIGGTATIGGAVVVKPYVS